MIFASTFSRLLTNFLPLKKHWSFNQREEKCLVSRFLLEKKIKQNASFFKLESRQSNKVRVWWHKLIQTQKPTTLNTSTVNIITISDTSFSKSFGVIQSEYNLLVYTLLHIHTQFSNLLEKKKSYFFVTLWLMALRLRIESNSRTVHYQTGVRTNCLGLYSRNWRKFHVGYEKMSIIEYKSSIFLQ